MDKNIQYAINKGYSIVKIYLTYEEAKQAKDELIALADSKHDGVASLYLIANLITFALSQLEA